MNSKIFQSLSFIFCIFALNLSIAAAASSFPKAKIIYTKGDQPRILVNGEQLLPLYLNGNVGYQPPGDNCGGKTFKYFGFDCEGPFDDEVRDFTKAGGRIVAINFTITTSSADIGKVIKRVLNINPSAYIILRLGQHNYKTELVFVKDENESKVDLGFKTLSPAFVQESSSKLKSLEDGFIAAGLASRIIGVHLTYMSEWFYSDFPDYSSFMEQKFKTLPELAPNPPKEIPSAKEMLAPSVGTSVRDLSTRKNEIAFNKMFHKNVAETIDSIAAGIRSRQPNLLIGAFYGYSFGLNERLVNSGHGAMETLLASKNIDMIMSPRFYHNGGTGGTMKPDGAIDTMRARKKLFIHEDDTFTHLLPEDVRQSEAQKRAPGYEEGLNLGLVYAMFIRNGLSMLKHGAGFYWLDLFGAGWHHDERNSDLWGAYKQLTQIYKEEEDLKTPTPEVAIIHDDDSLSYIIPRYNGMPIIYPRSSNDLFEASGINVGYYLSTDITNHRLPKQVRMIVLTNYIKRNRSFETALRDYKNDGRVIVVHSGVGLVSFDGTKSDDIKNGPYQVTGFSFKADKGPLKAKTVDSNTEIGYSPEFEPRLSVTNPEAVVLAKYKDNNLPAVSYEKRDGHFMVYAGAQLNVELIRHLANLAGANVYIPQGSVQVIETALKLGLYTLNDAPSSFELQLPEEMSLYRIFQGKEIPLGSSRYFSLNSTQKTMMLLSKKAPEKIGRAWVEAESLLAKHSEAWYSAYSESYYSAGQVLNSKSSGQPLETQVFGTKVSLYAKTGPNRGTAKVTIDNLPPVLVDLHSENYSASTVFLVRQNLPVGEHKVVVEVAPYDVSQGNKFVVIDAIIGNQLTEVEGESELVLRSGHGFDTEDVSFYSGGKSLICKTVGSRVIANIKGSQIQLLTRTGPNRGIMKVSIDGNKPFDVDLYSEKYSPVSNKILLAKGLNPDQVHRVVMEVSGVKTNKSTGYFMIVDALVP